MQTAGIIVAVVLAVVLMVAVLLLWLQRRSQQQAQQLAAELAADTVVRGPEQASYRGGSEQFPAVKGNCLLALTNERLVWQMLIGQRGEISLREITAVREDKTFRTEVHAGRTHLVIATNSGEVGFFTADTPSWAAALNGAR